jgi:hypothetical protein
MPDTIHADSIVIRDSALLPQAVRFETEPFVSGWKLVKNVGAYKLADDIRRAGWTFFSFAGEMRSTVLGGDSAATVRRAVSQILDRSKPQTEKFNSLEITRVTSRHLLGVPYTTVCVCTRHIWESMFFFQDDNSKPWHHQKTAPGLNEKGQPAVKVNVRLDGMGSLAKAPVPAWSLKGDSK